ncbi:MAG: biotin/lipoyl-binding protein [Lachnospiraceae bacterium]|nr:biotin/lipoyl-binding protein [Lachnospiraceae bacterium]
MEKKWIIGLLCFSLSVSLGGCGLLPKEEELRRTPVVRDFAGASYNYAKVGRGDVIRTKTVKCLFASAKEEQLSFAVGSEKVASVFVSLGDTVKEGDVLAETDTEGLRAELKEVGYDLKREELKIKHLKELISADPDGAEGYKVSLDELTNTHEFTLLKKEALQEKISERQITAKTDGTVSYVKSDLKGSITKVGEAVIKVVSGDECYFTAEKPDPDVKDGDAVEVMVGSVAYETIAKYEGDTLYFVAENAAEQPDVGSRGNANIVLGKAEDVLYLPNTVIRSIGGKKAVYFENEDGLKDLEYIDTGLEGDIYTEITGGLSFGDEVLSN